MDLISADDPLAQSADPVAENLDRLRDLFPSAFTEGRVDFDTLRQLLGDDVETEKERYGLTWHGKRKARQLALTPSRGTLRPAPNDSVDWDTTRNLMIEGDNLEVLKLLRKSYAGKVKLIYIDPPYNTGKDFVYKDSFQEPIRRYQEVTGQVEGGAAVTSNTESGGRFHTAWLNMIYPRIMTAWDMLTVDGFLLVSINDKELSRLKSVMDDICGEENFVSTIVFDKNRKNDAKLVSSGHEYMILYARNKAYLSEHDVRLRAPKEGAEEIKDMFDTWVKEFGDDWESIRSKLKEHYASFEEDDPRTPLSRFTRVDDRGPYRVDGDASWPGGGGPRYDVPHPSTGKPCTVPSRGWVWPTYERMKEEIDAGNIHFGEDESRIPSVRRDLFDKDTQVMRSVVFSYAQTASQDFSDLFDGSSVFQNPKSYRDLKRLVTYLSSPGDVVMDFFAGSGTTAHGVMLANEEDDGGRRFMLVQLPEELDASDKNQKAAVALCDQLGQPHRLSEITKERIRRAGLRIRESHPDSDSDLGFRVYKLDTSNIQAWNPDRTDLEGSLFAHVDNLVAGRTEADVLAELLLKLGLDLCVPIETREIGGHTVHAVGLGALFACLPDGDGAIDRDAARQLGEGIAGWRDELAPAGETAAYFRDGAFKDDVAKANLTAILEQRGVEAVRSL